MMKLKNERILCLSILSFVFGAILFVFGFFPLSHSSDARASLTDLPTFVDTVPLNKSVYTRHVSRIVVMVIDALRTDFVQANGSMRYTNDLISNGLACNLRVEVESPTVTMPRIKAMTTGTIPNFIDVVLNLGSSTLNIDSLLHQINDGDGKIVFAGDNTWVKMFPELFERKYENEDSLYVNDFDEGDKNITRVLIDELKHYDWELLVLHFLGLDHIGHVEGPFSDKVPPKLAQMDAIISTIHLHMDKWDKVFPKPSMLIITGDHGMRDAGGHGGSSYAETNVPFIVVGQKCGESTRESYKQIDIAATLAVLSALPIPASSIGSLIPELLADLTMEHQLFAFHYNAKRLMDKLISAEGSDRIADTEIHEQFEEAKVQHETFIRSSDENLNSVNSEAAFRRAKILYVTATKAMSEQLSKSYIDYDDFSIGAGLLVLLVSLLNILLSHSLSMDSKSIPLKWLAATVIAGFGGHVILIGGTDSYTQSSIFAAICLLVTFTVALFVQLIHVASIEQFVKMLRTSPRICQFFVFGICFHSISYASSSFIEEEHQTWYYLTSTALIALYSLETRSMLQSVVSDGKNRYAQSIRRRQYRWLGLFVAHLIARRLNQTGDKWLMQPDIGDWLAMDEHRMWNSIFVIASLCCLFVNCVDFGSILTNILTLTACALIYYFRAIGGFVYFAGIKKSDATSTCLTLFGVNFIEIVAINVVPIIYRRITFRLQKFDVKLTLGTSIVLFAVISALTHKPHNIFLVGIQIFTCRVVSESCNRLFADEKSKAMNLVAQCIAHYWIGRQFFFYQGNSNSLASIDLNAGYIGLRSFDFVSVGILLTINTFSGPILSIMLLAYNVYQCRSDATAKQSHKTYRGVGREANRHQETSELNYVLRVIPILFGFPFAIYTICVLAFRNHIFVWTVFSPKLLYEFYHLCLMAGLWFLLFLIPHVK